MSSDPTYGLSTGEDILAMPQTERFYKSVINKVMENTKHHFLANGVSEKIHDRLKKVRICC